MPEITDIKGVGPVLGEAFKKCGFENVEQVAGASVSALAVVPGLGESRAKSMIDAALVLLANGPVVNAEPMAMNAATQGDLAGAAEATKEAKKAKKKGGSGKKKKDKKKNKKKKNKKKKSKNKNKKKK